MTRRIVLLIALLVPLAAPAQSLDSLRSLADTSLTGLLKSQLGVTEKQAAGGASVQKLLAGVYK